MASNGLNIQDIVLEDIAVELVKFYHGLVQTETDSRDVSANKKTLSKLRKTYTKKLRKDDFSTVSFDDSDVRSAYLFQFCPSFTLAVASHFLTLMKGISHQQVRKLALKDNLTMCCLGGGPGTEVVAICKVLLEVRKHCCPNADKPLLVNVTVVDAENGWSTTSKSVVESLPQFVDESEVKINYFHFINYDLTEGVPENITDVLNQSDLVTMTKFLSALHGRKNSGVRESILQETCERIPDDGILFLLDSSGWNYFEKMVQTVDSFLGMELIYGPEKKTKRLSKSSKRLCRELFSTIYGNQCCTAQSSNKAAAWCKRSSTDTS